MNEDDLCHELREAANSMERWQNSIDDGGPSGAARAGHLHKCAMQAASQLEEAKEIIRVLAQANIYDDQLHEVLISAETLRRARNFLKENGNG